MKEIKLLESLTGKKVKLKEDSEPTSEYTILIQYDQGNGDADLEDAITFAKSIGATVDSHVENLMDEEDEEIEQAMVNVHFTPTQLQNFRQNFRYAKDAVQLVTASGDYLE